MKITKNNTAVVDSPSLKSVILHQTEIVRVENRTITLDNGGWVTSTTAKRMNQALRSFGYPVSVSRADGEMFYRLHAADGSVTTRAFSGSRAVINF